VFISEQAILLIDALALVAVVVSTVEVCVAVVRIRPFKASGHALRAVWLNYARWLVGALSLQLAADIIETSISTSWDTIGRVASIAVIRTALNFFLDRDVEEKRALQRPDDRSAPTR